MFSWKRSWVLIEDLAYSILSFGRSTSAAGKIKTQWCTIRLYFSLLVRPQHLIPNYIEILWTGNEWPLKHQLWSNLQVSRNYKYKSSSYFSSWLTTQINKSNILYCLFTLYNNCKWFSWKFSFIRKLYVITHFVTVIFLSLNSKGRTFTVTISLSCWKF